MKEDWKPGTMIYPLPAVLVSCGSTPEEYNILTIAWTGTICTNPPMCYISVRPRTPLLRHHQAEYGIRHQPHHERYGTGHGLVWRTLRKGLQQIRGNASDTGEKHRSQRASYRGITALHRMPGKGDYGSRFARHVYSGCGKCTCRYP